MPWAGFTNLSKVHTNITINTVIRRDSSAQGSRAAITSPAVEADAVEVDAVELEGVTLD